MDASLNSAAGGDSADFAATTTMADDPKQPFVTVAPRKTKLHPRGATVTTPAAASSPLRPPTLGGSSRPTASTASSNAAAAEPSEAATTLVDDDAHDDGLNGDTLRNGSLHRHRRRLEHELRDVPAGAVLTWVQNMATDCFSCYLCRDFLGACVDGVVMVSDSTNQQHHMVCQDCRFGDAGMKAFPDEGRFITTPAPSSMMAAIAGFRQMLSNPLSAIVDANTNTASNAAAPSGRFYFTRRDAPAANRNGNGLIAEEQDDDDDDGSSSTSSASDTDPEQQAATAASPTAAKKNRFTNPDDLPTIPPRHNGTEGEQQRNNVAFTASSPFQANRAGSGNKLREVPSPNATTPADFPATSNTASTNAAEGPENERPPTNQNATSNTTPNKTSSSSLPASVVPSPAALAVQRRHAVELRALQSSEESDRTKLNVEEGIAFVQFEKRAATNLKNIKSQKRGSSKQLKIEADEAYEKAKYHIAIDLYDKAIECVSDGTARLSVLYGNRSAALFMAMRYEECIEDCLRVAAKHQQQQNEGATTSSSSTAASISGMVKMYQRAIKAATMMGDLEKALSLYNKIDASATTEQMNTDRMKVMLAVDELREAKKHHCTPEGDRLWEVLISKFGDAVTFRVKYAESLAASGKMEKAIDVLSVVQSPSRPPSVAHRIALYKYKSGFEHFDSARETLEPFVRSNDECAKLAKLIDAVDEEKQRGNQLFSSRQFAASVTHYTRAIDLDPTNDRILRILYCNRAAAYKELNKLQEGVDDCTRAIALDRNFSKAYARRARCLMNLKDYDGAVRDFTHASKCDPADRELAREQKNAEEHQAKEIEKEKDHYYMLGVTKTAPEAEIKKRYRELSLRWHPDKCMGQSDDEKVVSERKFKAVSEAYTVLMSVEKRREYDLKCDRERYTSSAFGSGGSYGFSAGSGGTGAYRSSTTTGTAGAGAGAYRAGASRWSGKYGGAGGAAGGPSSATGGTTGGFW